MCADFGWRRHVWPLGSLLANMVWRELYECEVCQVIFPLSGPSLASVSAISFPLMPV